MAIDTQNPKIAGLLNVLGESVTKEDFVNSFKNLTALVVKTHKMHSDAIDGMKQTYERMLTKLQNDHTSSLEELKSKVDHLFVQDQMGKMMNEHNARMQAIDEKLKTIKHGKDSVVPGPQGKQGIAGRDGGNDTPKMIKYKLEELTGNQRLDVSAIKGLDEYLTQNKPPNKLTVYGPGKTKILVADLSSLLDGITKTFRIGSHFGIIGVYSSSNPFAWRPMIDYTEVGQNIVFDAAIDAASMLAVGQTLVVQYMK